MWDSLTQRFADRGYAVLMVEFRGTRGFGWDRVNVPWNDAMVEDINDGVDWAIARGVADPNRLAAYGKSFGGWASLRLATHEDRRFRCAVDAFGPADLTVPNGHITFRRDRVPRVLSPSEWTARLVGSTLLYTGGKDGPNPETIVSSFVERATWHKRPTTWIRFPDEGHGVTTPGNREAMTAITQAFLAACLGGPAEPLTGGWAGANLEIRAGGEFIPGLKAAVAAP